MPFDNKDMALVQPDSKAQRENRPCWHVFQSELCLLRAIGSEDGWVLGLVGSWIGGFLDWWVLGLVGSWIGGFLDWWVLGLVGSWIGGFLDWWVLGLVGSWIGGFLDWWVLGLVGSWIGGFLDWWVLGLVGSWIGGFLDWWVLGLVGSWITRRCTEYFNIGNCHIICGSVGHNSIPFIGTQCLGCYFRYGGVGVFTTRKSYMLILLFLGGIRILLTSIDAKLMTSGPFSHSVLKLAIQWIEHNVVFGQ